MKTKLILTLVLLLSVAVSSVSAQSIRKNARSERARIVQGHRSGELTKRETVKLSREQKEIRRDIRKAKRNDGRIDPRERKHIRKEQRKASRRIYRAKHNNRKKA